MTAEEKIQLIDYLKDTAQKLESICEKFANQQHKKLSENTWSAAQVVEHLAITEKGFRNAIDYALTQPQSSGTDEKKSNNYVRKASNNRSVKVEAPERVQPKNGLGIQQSLQLFKTQRADNIAFFENLDASIDVHAHFWKHPFFGEIDVYQIGLVLSAHLERHLQQLEEIYES